MEDFIVIYFSLLFVGAFFGLIPYFVGIATNKPILGRQGWIWTTVSGLLFLQFIVAIVFVVVILVRPYDAQLNVVASNPPPPRPVAPPPPQGGTLAITCLSGPMRGRTYSIDPQGIMIGRGSDCAICFAEGSGGVSGHHCSLTWSGDRLYLTDMGSTYGTYMADGRRLAAQSPVQVSAGTRFCLGSASTNQFQIVIHV